MKIPRRDFIALLGCAAAWPFPACAQPGAMPVIGIVDPRSPDGVVRDLLRAFRQGLKDIGFVEGDNVAIAYRWGEGQMDRLPELAADLSRRQVAVIFATGGLPSVSAVTAATTTIPYVFIIGEDPVKLGLVASLARPGGNATGINFFSSELTAKRLELLRELVPGAVRVAALVNPLGSAGATTSRDVEAAAGAMGLQLQIFNASSSRDVDAAFAALVPGAPDALFVAPDPFFSSRRIQLVQLATLHKLPAAYSGRHYPEVGGLMSYGSSHSPAVIPLTIAEIPMKPVIVQAGFLPLEVPNFEVRHVRGDGRGMQITDAARGAALAECLGQGTVALLRGHGNVVVGSSVRQVTVFAVYTDINARMQMQAMPLNRNIVALDGPELFGPDEFDINRPWEHFRQKLITGNARTMVDRSQFGLDHTQ